jgi:hypothetical protein
MVDDKFSSYRDRDLFAPEQTSRGALLAELARLTGQDDPTRVLAATAGLGPQTTPFTSSSVGRGRTSTYPNLTL